MPITIRVTTFEFLFLQTKGNAISGVRNTAYQSNLPIVSVCSSVMLPICLKDHAVQGILAFIQIYFKKQCPKNKKHPSLRRDAF